MSFMSQDSAEFTFTLDRPGPPSLKQVSVAIEQVKRAVPGYFAVEITTTVRAMPGAQPPVTVLIITAVPPDAPTEPAAALEVPGDAPTQVARQKSGQDSGDTEPVGITYAQLDQAVWAGQMTQCEADAVKRYKPEVRPAAETKGQDAETER